MTEFGVISTTHQAEDRSWLIGPHGTDPGTTPSITLDLALFDQATHFPQGTIPSGIVLAKNETTELFGPYDPAATDGRQAASCILFGSLPARATSGRVGGAGVVHGFVNPDRLPLKAGAGSLDTAARGALTLIHFGL
ncbi:head decoration protein [Arthrobacter sp. SX1312]|uniref:head decoration protein n=1 Tax=Arthrobacter sp. SX1312 TaxID=2058896 RepID=UPI000CE3E10A|nr:head decoration protein [Arthrobacter sp. SX1312]